MTSKEQQDLILSRLRDLEYELKLLNKRLDSQTRVIDKLLIKLLEDNS